ncbi:MAG: TlpA disulfide reductase family protein [Planctomycetota bacterium]
MSISRSYRATLAAIVVSGAPVSAAQGVEDLSPREVFERISELEQQLMSGGPAPTWSADTLEGEPLSLDDLEGEIVLIDFWATWCPPCVRAMPQIQEIHEDYADRGVRVLGMNQDRGNRALVERFVDARDITFTQVMDTDGAINNEFGVTGIPTTFILDADGNIVHKHVGFGASMKDELTGVIDQLLDGESMALGAERREEIESELDALRGRAETFTDNEVDLAREGAFLGGGNADQTIELDEVGVEEFPLEWPEDDIMLAGGQAFTLDVDGDGVTDHALAGGNRLSIISGATGEVRQVRLREANGLGTFWGIHAVQLDGAPHILVSFDDIGATDSHNIALFAAQERLWVYRPDVPRGIAVDCDITSADLDGDGVDEIIVGLNMWGEGDVMAFGGAVDVLNARNGALIARHNLDASPSSMLVVPSDQDNADVVMIIVNGELLTLTASETPSGV